MSEPVYINLEFTPNPNSLKFVVNQTLIAGAANFTDKSKAEKSPLAKKLFSVPGVGQLLIGSNFVTITRIANADWEILSEEVPKVIETHIKSGEPHLDPDFSFSSGTSNSEAEKKIIEVLDKEIRPAVQMDGGDITFQKYEEGIVYLHLQGACTSCPSSIQTLKMGVESRLKEAVPSIKEVVQV